MYGLDYLFYSVFLGIFLVLVFFLLALIKKWKLAKKLLFFVVPFVIVIQIYFWNIEINTVTKSYLFPSKSFTCSDDEKTVIVPLPIRTVFHGRSNGCSPFYTTFNDEKSYVNFYKEKLSQFIVEGKIEEFEFGEINMGNGEIRTGYTVRVNSTTTYHVFYHSYTKNRGQLLIIF